MPAMGEDWLMEAEDYAMEYYQLTLEQLGIDYDASLFSQCPQYTVDQAFKGYDPSPEDQEDVTRIGGWG